MVTIQEALNLINAEIATLANEVVGIEKMTHRILAEDLVAPIHLPPFDQSAMDGFALRLAPNVLSYKIVGELAAGSSQEYKLHPGECISIYTGAKVPDTANAVVMQEDAIKNETQISLTTDVIIGQHIRTKGEQIAEGTIALTKGTLLTPSLVGFICSLGITTTTVYKQPKIVVIATGSELTLPGTNLSVGKIYESNSFMLKSAVEFYQLGFVQIDRSEDSLEATKKAITKALETADFILLSGGISVGKYDFVERALTECGVKGVFHKVKQKPGKPLYFGKSDTNKFIFALPGNPSAAMTSFLIYVFPALKKAAGFPFKGLKKIQLQLSKDYVKSDERAHLLKSSIENNKVTILDGQNSDVLKSFAQSTGIAVIPAENKVTLANDFVDVYLL